MSGGVKYLMEDSSGDVGEEGGGFFGFDNVGFNGERGYVGVCRGRWSGCGWR